MVSPVDVEGVELDMKSKEGDPIVEGVNAKVCSACRELKPFSEFMKHRNKKYGVGNQCRSCLRRYTLRKYGLTVEGYTEIL